MVSHGGTRVRGGGLAHTMVREAARSVAGAGACMVTGRRARGHRSEKGIYVLPSYNPSHSYHRSVTCSQQPMSSHSSPRARPEASAPPSGPGTRLLWMQSSAQSAFPSWGGPREGERRWQEDRCVKYTLERYSPVASSSLNTLLAWKGGVKLTWPRAFFLPRTSLTWWRRRSSSRCETQASMSLALQSYG